MRRHTDIIRRHPQSKNACECGRKFANFPSSMAPQALVDLVQAFERNREAYLSPQYKEAEVRREFIDPFFEILGWDMQNRRKYAERYKDVVHEPSLEQDFGSQRPITRFNLAGS